MATGFMLSVGYNSGALHPLRADFESGAVSLIHQEARSISPSYVWSKTSGWLNGVMELGVTIEDIEAYLSTGVSFTDDGIFMSASGSGSARQIKEYVAYYLLSKIARSLFNRHGILLSISVA